MLTCIPRKALQLCRPDELKEHFSQRVCILIIHLGGIHSNLNVEGDLCYLARTSALHLLKVRDNRTIARKGLTLTVVSPAVVLNVK